MRAVITAYIRLLSNPQMYTYTSIPNEGNKSQGQFLGSDMDILSITTRYLLQLQGTDRRVFLKEG
ncbi:MAG: hypothetical protein NVS4B12_04640 [Ktedonobacteraceae bacterium]